MSVRCPYISCVSGYFSGNLIHTAAGFISAEISLVPEIIEGTRSWLKHLGDVNNPSRPDVNDAPSDDQVDGRGPIMGERTMHRRFSRTTLLG